MAVQCVVCVVKMNELEYCAIKKYFVLNGLSPTEISSNLVKVYKVSAPSSSTFFKKSAVGQGQIRQSLMEQIMILEDGRLQVYEIAKAKRNSEGTVHFRVVQGGCRIC